MKTYVYKEKFKQLRKDMGWTNKRVSEITGNTLNSVEVVTTKCDSEFPRWAKLSIELHEQMLKNGRIVYK